MRHISSIRAWRSSDVQQKAQGLRQKVLQALAQHQTQGGMTGQELNQWLDSSSAHKRLSELNEKNARLFKDVVGFLEQHLEED